MTIINADIKFRQSERMTDFDDGGGRMSANQIVDNAMNNVFSDRSDLDAILGRVSLRKLFLHVDTPNADTYLGAFVFLTDPPDDPLVHVSLFDTREATDERAAARNYVEGYRAKGPRTQLTLYGLHLAGQSTIQVYCRTETPSPDIGDVLCLSVEADGYVPDEQFVRVQEVASRITTTFEDSSGQFTRDVLVIRITTPLTVNFLGQEDPQRLTGALPPPTRVRSTQVANAARYYSVLPVAEEAREGDLSLRVVSPYIPIVPSSQAETPLVDVLAGMGALAMVRSGAIGALTWSGPVTAAAGVSVVRYLGTPFMRRSLHLTAAGVALRDDGDGNVVAVDPADLGWSGSADYTTGAFTVSRSIGFSGTLSATATPAGAVLQQGFSDSLPITPTNRQQSYVFQLAALPAPGTALLDYRALGRWIRLADRGNGVMSGATGEGSATINYTTGTIAATLGALPDADSAIILSWGIDVRARNSSGEITPPAPRYVQQLDHDGIVPGSLSMAWASGGVAKTATANSAGVLSGDATGRVVHTDGRVEFSMTAIPDASIAYEFDYVDADKRHTETFTPTAAGGAVSFTLAHAPAEESVQAQWNVTYEVSPTLVGLGRSINVAIIDNGAGGWHEAFPGTNTIDYATGAIVLTVEANLPQYVPQWESRQNEATGGTSLYPNGYSLSDVGGKFATGTPLVVRYVESGASPATVIESHALPPIRINFAAGTAGPAVPGSVRFDFRGRTYVDRAGSLVYDVSPMNNAGTLGGSYDYSANVATITAIGSGTSNTATISSLLTRYTEPGVSGVFFRTPGAPLREGSFTIRATSMAGTLITGTADINGVIAGTGLKGSIDWQTGVTQVSFGALVTAAGHESEPWYDPDYIVGGQIWQPTQVDPASIFFGTVVYRAIPADPSIIGIDPVRLPSDGRVPAYQAGGVIVVHHTQVTSVASPVAGTTTSLGRTQVGLIEVHDAAGEPILDTWYTLDLAAGTVTWADPLNLSAYTMPVVIRDRIEQAMQCADVQITGELGLQAALTRDFPAGTLVSSAIAIGDMQSRYTNLFDQQTYAAGVWSDVISGSPAAASYNDAVYPIAVSNHDAIDERWAVVFTAPTIVNVIGETTGQVLAAVSIGSAIAPINPVTGTPYFTIAAAGWGSGWAAQNVLRFNTISATRPIWAARVTLQGEITEESDSARIQAYGNAH